MRVGRKEEASWWDTPQARHRDLDFLPGGNGGTMKDEKDRITGVQGM